MARAIVMRGNPNDTGYAEQLYYLAVQVAYVEPNAPVQVVNLQVPLSYNDSPVEIRTKIGQTVRANLPPNMTPIPTGDVTQLLTVSKD